MTDAILTKRPIIERSILAETEWTFLCAGRLLPGEEIISTTFVLLGPDLTVQIGAGDRSPANDASSVTFWVLGGARGAECKGECVLRTTAPPDRRHVVEFLVRSS